MNFHLQSNLFYCFKLEMQKTVKKSYRLVAYEIMFLVKTLFVVYINYYQ